MGSESSVPQKIIDYAMKQETITLEDIIQNFNVSRTTAKNYLSRLAKMDAVKRIGRGIYQVGKGTTATAEL